jgi:hypothetical protein
MSAVAQSEHSMSRLPVVQNRRRHRAFRGARRTLLVRTQAGELRIEVPVLTRPKVGETIEIGAAKSALWAFACS